MHTNAKAEQSFLLIESFLASSKINAKSRRHRLMIDSWTPAISRFSTVLSCYQSSLAYFETLVQVSDRECHHHNQSHHVAVIYDLAEGAAPTTKTPNCRDVPTPRSTTTRGHNGRTRHSIIAQTAALSYCRLATTSFRLHQRHPKNREKPPTRAPFFGCNRVVATRSSTSIEARAPPGVAPLVCVDKTRVFMKTKRERPGEQHIKTTR